MRHPYLPLYLILLAVTGLSCKNFIGNPHRVAQATRVSPAQYGALRVEPANWWTGMKHNQVEILFHREGLASFDVRLGKAKGIKLLKTERTDSPNYLFVTLQIASKAPAQRVPLLFSKDGFVLTCEFPVLNRRQSAKAQGITSRDAVYLVFPDRFANGDTTNDRISGMLEGADRKVPDGRHGGDLKGIADHLDYISDLGFSAIWLNPELENDQAEGSYHGYAVTDHYRVDRRLGTNEELRSLISECHKRGIKVIRDVVLNHIGDNHYWMKDLPARDWLNQWPEFTRTTYRAPTLVDPYASGYDRRRFQDGWFDRRMPDLNQRNPHVANYLIQQAIWWVEYAGFDDFRIDTYTYSDQAFCSRWCRALRDEYPDLGMVGEIWENGVVMQGFFADNQPMQRAGFDSNLPGVVDFQLCFAIREALTREQGWTEGISRVYYTLAKDFFYQDPYRNLVMLDNHDMTRFYTHIGEDLDKYKSGIAFLLTTRGIPQVYYATEILATGLEHPSHGNIRKDFPGGWPGDTLDKFTASGRTPIENEAFQYLRTLLHYRNATPALQTGKLMQFVPEDGLYVYFRYDQAKTVMIAINTSGHPVQMDMRRFEERTQGFHKAVDVVSGKEWPDLNVVSIEKNGTLVLELVP